LISSTSSDHQETGEGFGLGPPACVFKLSYSYFIPHCEISDQIPGYIPGILLIKCCFMLDS